MNEKIKELTFNTLKAPQGFEILRIETLLKSNRFPKRPFKLDFYQMLYLAEGGGVEHIKLTLNA